MADRLDREDARRPKEGQVMADQDAPDRLAEARAWLKTTYNGQKLAAGEVIVRGLIVELVSLTQAHSTLTAEVSRIREEHADLLNALREFTACDLDMSTLSTKQVIQIARDEIRSVSDESESRFDEIERLSEENEALKSARPVTTAVISSLQQLRDENKRLKTPRYETFEQWWEAKPALPSQTMDRLEPIRDDELKQVELGCMAWLLAESGHAASLRLSRILLRLHKAEQETGDLRDENERLKAAPRGGRTKIQHGIDCSKNMHLGGGYLHDADDDRPYDVDNVTYCGRCHQALSVEASST